jgi:peptide/nickel transport system permease protein
MQQYLMRRLLLYVPTLILASMGIFAIMRVLPGDVALIILGGEESSPSAMEQLDSLRKELGLLDPLPVQYGNWMWSMVNGDFGGRSILDREPLPQIIARRLPVTLQLTLYTVILGWFISVPLGLIAAVYQNKWPDYIIRVTTLAGHALPSFWLALVLLLIMLIYFRWTPPLFYTDLWDDPWNHIKKMIWPALVLAWGFSSYLTRVTRSNVLEVLRQDYVRTARSKGLTETVVVMRHALRNALIPVITLGGLQLVGLLSGTVILETIFSLPGIGQGVVLAATERDYPVIQSLVLLLVFVMLSLNLIVDMIYAFVDPRISYG